MTFEEKQFFGNLHYQFTIEEKVLRSIIQTGEKYMLDM